MKTLKHYEPASERKLTANIHGTPRLTANTRSVPCTQQSTSTQPARSKCDPGDQSPSDATAAQIKQPSTINAAAQEKNLSNFSSKKICSERQPTATIGAQQQRAARKKPTSPTEPPKLQNHGVSISQQAPAPAGTASVQKEKESKGMISSVDNEAASVGPVEDFISKEEVARRLGRGVRTIDSWKQLGIIPYYKVGKCVYFRWSEVQDAIARNGRRMN